MTDNIIQNAQKAVAARAYLVSQQLQEKASIDPFWNEVAVVFNAAYQNPILTTAKILSESPIEIYAGTGGWGCYGPPKLLLPLDSYPNALAEMWVRDACAQYHAYLGIIADHKGQTEDDGIADLGSVIEGIVRTCADFLTRKTDNPCCPKPDPDTINITIHSFESDGRPGCNGLEYEPDSLAYLIFLAWSYEAASGSSAHLDEYFWAAMRETIRVFGTNDTDGGYLHVFEDGSALTLTPNRPSDDLAQRNFNIPVNAFCAVAMEKLADLAQRYTEDPYLITAAGNIGAALRLGIGTKGTAAHSSYSQIYVYETDAGVARRLVPLGTINEGPCFVTQDGTPIFMDDANIPSLLSLPYLGFCDVNDPLYLATRQFLLSPHNPFYFTGTDKKTQTLYAGIGSCHSQVSGGLKHPIWPMAITMQGLTSTCDLEKMSALRMLVSASQPNCSDIPYGCSDPSLCESDYPAANYMHESFEADSASSYTRGWFAWANALFGEWIDTMVREGSLPS